MYLNAVLRCFFAQKSIAIFIFIEYLHIPALRNEFINFQEIFCWIRRNKYPVEIFSLFVFPPVWLLAL